MDDEVKQMGIFAVAVTLIAAILVFGGQGCDQREQNSRQDVRQRISDCISAGKAPLECREVFR
jgi:hypothetical protein